MGLHNSHSAVLSAVIFNALIIIALVPLALRGVRYRPDSAASLLRRNLLIYGLGGIMVPFPGIWIIDQIRALIGAGVRSILCGDKCFPRLRMTLVMTVLTGLFYPGVVTAITQAVFPEQANGSLIVEERESDWFGADRANVLATRNTSSRAYRRPARLRRLR